MAKRYRLDTLNQDQKEALRIFAEQYFPQRLSEKFMDSLEQNGKITDDLYKEGGFEGTQLDIVKKKVDEFVKGLPSKRDAINKYLETVKDSATLEVPDLQQKLDAYQQLQGLPKDTAWDRNALIENMVAQLRGTITRGNNIEGNLYKTATYAVDALLNGNYDSKKAYDLLTQIGTSGDAEGNQEILSPIAESGIRNIFNTQLGDPRFQTGGKDYQNDIKDLQALIESKTTLAEKNKAVEDYLTALPEELRKSREEFLSGEVQRAQGAFEDYAPYALSDLNRTGMLFSGQAEDLLTTKAVDLGYGLQGLQSDLEQQDNQIYFDAAYQNTLKNELASRDDYRSAIETERNRVNTERSNAFKTSQAELNRQLDAELNRSDLQRNYELNRAKLESQKSAQSRQNTANLISTGLGALTSVGVAKATSTPSQSAPTKVP